MTDSHTQPEGGRELREKFAKAIGREVVNKWRGGHPVGGGFDSREVADALLLEFSIACRSAPSPSAGGEMREGAFADVLAERVRQEVVEQWTPEHDDEHKYGELAWAAACYAANAGCAEEPQPIYSLKQLGEDVDEVPEGWPWDKKWWKPKTRREDLVRAAALLIAEIERLDRAALAAKGETGE